MLDMVPIGLYSKNRWSSLKILGVTMTVCNGKTCIGCKKLKPLGGLDEHPIAHATRRTTCRACCSEAVKVIHGRMKSRGARYVSVSRDLQTQIGAY